jgi:1-acyl-sn-glycerol-3-phosphate acyltransferase
VKGLYFDRFTNSVLNGIRSYLRVEIDGIENVPKSGPYIMISNHSGFTGFDALMIINEIRRAKIETPHPVAHKLWFQTLVSRTFSERMGFIKADMLHCRLAIQGGQSLLLFPEGEAGNFKPTNRRYRLQEFKRGFVRLAGEYSIPVIPACVIGAEETNINLSQIKFTKGLIGSVIPIPLNILPIPIKWKICFLPPMKISLLPGDALKNEQKVKKEAQKFRHYIQRAIIQELRKRSPVNLTKSVFLDSEDIPE